MVPPPAETTVHTALHKWRVNPVNEIFDLSSQEARDTIDNIKKIILQLSKNIGLPMPMERRIDYDYWRIAKQAAKAGRQWIIRYNEEQIKVKSSKIKEEKINKKKEKNNNKKNVAKNKEVDTVVQNIDNVNSSLFLKYFINLYAVKKCNITFHSTNDFVKNFLKFVEDKEHKKNYSITNRKFNSKTKEYLYKKDSHLKCENGFINMVRHNTGYIYTILYCNLGNYIYKISF